MTATARYSRPLASCMSPILIPDAPEWATAACARGSSASERTRTAIVSGAKSSVAQPFAGPFTIQSLSPHRTPAVDEHGELIDEIDAAYRGRAPGEQEAENYRRAIMENLAKAGVHQKDRGDAIRFDSLTPWPGDWIAAEGRYREGEGDEAEKRRAGIFIRHRQPRRPRRLRPRGGRCRVRHRHRLRLQLRGARAGVS